ncbi:MAG TPA: hypothetical protein VFA26_21005, partial [Gemmataceae bacterium]|nr:hypothetical protein [Gemmataceae bacterium]
MRVVVTQEHPGQIEPVRHVLLGLGLECAAGDCVTYTELPVRLAQGPVDLVLVRAGAEAGTTREAVHQAAALTTAPVFALGPATDGQQILQTIQSGAREYLDEARLREQLERALAKLRDSGTVRHGTGLVVGVTSPTLGAGVTTVASNLAFLWGEQQRDQVTLAELGREAAEFALHLDLQPRHTPADLSREWQRMDAALLKRSMLAHPGGVQVLAYPPETLLTAALEPEAVRKAVLLMRTTYAYSVLDLGHLLHD